MRPGPYTQKLKGADGGTLAIHGSDGSTIHDHVVTNAWAARDNSQEMHQRDLHFFDPFQTLAQIAALVTRASNLRSECVQRRDEGGPLYHQASAHTGN